MWGRIKIRYCGDRGFVYTRWLERASGLPPPSVGSKQSRRQKSAVDEQRQEKAVKKSSTVVVVFKCDRYSATHPNKRSREGSFMGEDFEGGKRCRDQFPFYRELSQKRKLVYGLARSVIRCFLGSGVFDLPTFIVPWVLR